MLLLGLEGSARVHSTTHVSNPQLFSSLPKTTILPSQRQQSYHMSARTLPWKGTKGRAWTEAMQQKFTHSMNRFRCRHLEIVCASEKGSDAQPPTLVYKARTQVLACVACAWLGGAGRSHHRRCSEDWIVTNKPPKRSETAPMG